MEYIKFIKSWNTWKEGDVTTKVHLLVSIDFDYELFDELKRQNIIKEIQ